MRATWKVTSGELLTKQAKIKIIFIAYILKLLLNLVTTRIEAFVVSVDKLLDALSNKCASATFGQLPSTSCLC
jgi:hypothetical protein